MLFVVPLHTGPAPGDNRRSFLAFQILLERVSLCLRDSAVGVAVLAVALSINLLFHIQFGADDHYSDSLHPAGGAGSDFNFESWFLILSRGLIWENFEF